MTRTARRPATRLAVVLGVAAVALAGCGGSPVRAGAAAVIGSNRISTEELARTVDEGLADPAAAQAAADRGAYQREVLGRLISDEVVATAATRRGVSVTPAQVDMQYSALETSLGGAEQLKQQAAAAGLTLARVHDLARARALTTALGDVLTADVQVPEAQLEQAYQAGLDTFDQVRTAQVQVASLAEAQALLPQASGLTDSAFADLARSRSLDEATQAAGGDLGYAPRSAFVSQGLQDYGTAAFAARTGDTFAVASQRGGHVVRVLGRRTTTLQQASVELRRTLLQKQREAAVQALLAGTARDLHIIVNPRFGTWDGMALTVSAPADTGRHEVSRAGVPAPGESQPPAAPAPGDGPPPAAQ